MTKDVVTVVETTHYKEVVEVLAAHAVSAVPVVAGDGRVIGVVSEADLLHKMEFAGAEPYAGFLERKGRRTARAKSEAELAGELMSSPAIVISLAESVTTAARLMDAERVKRIPVVDQYGRLVGIVSRRDLLRVHLRGDEAIRDEVVEDVLVRTLWIAPGTITVAVNHGVVSLAGTVDRLSTIALVVRLVEGVAGVVDVANHLTYHHDDTTNPGPHQVAFR
jgi:CBS-domain-containing membrane protein